MNITRKHLLLIILAATAASMTRDTRADMVARWTLDDGTAGIQNLGTDGATSNLVAPAAAGSPTGTGIAGGPLFNATGGKLGGFAGFDGTQALITTTAGNAGDDLTGYPFTMSAWIRPQLPTVATNRGAAVAMSQTSAASTYYTLGVEASSPDPPNSNDVEAVRRNTAFVSTEAASTSPGVRDGEWHHIVVVNSSNTRSRIYYDGALAGINTTSAAFSPNVNSLSLGGFLRSSTSWTDKYKGDIDEVQIYNETLYANQIQHLFNLEAGPLPTVQACDVDLMNGCTIADLQIIADHFFNTTLLRSDGDLNDDGIVNFADYRIWKDVSGSGATLESLGVPEPGAICLVAFLLPWLGVRRGKR